MKPAAVAFDFDHTLGTDNKLERTVGVALLMDRAREFSRPLDPADAERAIDAALVAYRSARASLEDALRAATAPFVTAGIDCEEVVSRFRAEVVRRAPAFVRPLPGALLLLDKLAARGIPHALLTNGWSPLQDEKARLIGFRGAIFVVEGAGVQKPSPRAFEKVVRYFDVPPEGIWYVGDDPTADIAGAHAAGLRPIWLDWENRSYPEGQEPPAHRIRTLDEVLPLLGEE